jgi:hypothetical protein
MYRPNQLKHGVEKAGEIVWDRKGSIKGAKYVFVKIAGELQEPVGQNKVKIIKEE